jgi:glutathione S-transferase
MSLILYYHPLSSYCQKVLIALYENATPFTAHFVDLADGEPPFATAWPIRKFPVLRDETADRWIAESSIIIEYLGQHHPGAAQLLPRDPDRALEVRMSDRFIDLYIHLQLQAIVGEALRPDDARDPHGVTQAKTMLRTALGTLDVNLQGHAWAVGDEFSLADCAAAPPLFYVNEIMPLVDDYPNVAGYFERLKARPSYARVLREAEPYLHLFPKARVA